MNNIKNHKLYIEQVFRDLSEIPFFNTFLKDKANYFLLKDTRALIKIGIHSCLKCKCEWSDTVQPAISYSLPRELFKSFEYRDEMVISHSIVSPIIQKEYDNAVEHQNPEKLCSYIGDIYGFNAICETCDNIYSNLYEKNRNFTISNKRHVALLVEKASYFKYYREQQITYFISKILKMKKKKSIPDNDWELFENIRRQLKNNRILSVRKSLFSREKMLLSCMEDKITHNICKIKPSLNIMFTDYFNIHDNQYILINAFDCYHESYLIISYKTDNISKYDAIKKDIIRRINELDYTDMILTSKYFIQK